MPIQNISDFIEHNQIATDSEITLVTHINGWSEESLNDIIYERTGFHSVQQLYDCDEPFDYSDVQNYLETSEEDDEEEEEDEE